LAASKAHFKLDWSWLYGWAFTGILGKFQQMSWSTAGGNKSEKCSRLVQGRTIYL